MSTTEQPADLQAELENASKANAIARAATMSPSKVHQSPTPSMLIEDDKSNGGSQRDSS